MCSRASALPAGSVCRRAQRAGGRPHRPRAGRGDRRDAGGSVDGGRERPRAMPPWPAKPDGLVPLIGRPSIHWARHRHPQRAGRCRAGLPPREAHAGARQWEQVLGQVAGEPAVLPAPTYAELLVGVELAGARNAPPRGRRSTRSPCTSPSLGSTRRSRRNGPGCLRRQRGRQLIPSNES